MVAYKKCTLQFWITLTKFIFFTIRYHVRKISWPTMDKQNFPLRQEPFRWKITLIVQVFLCQWQWRSKSGTNFCSSNSDTSYGNTTSPSVIIEIFSTCSTDCACIPCWHPSRYRKKPRNIHCYNLTLHINIYTGKMSLSLRSWRSSCNVWTKKIFFW